MTTEQKVIPAGYWESANGDLVPMNKIKPIDKDRHRTVVELCVQAKVASTELLAFKLSAMHTFNEFIARSLEAYDVKHGGTKGNVILNSFDGKYRIIRQMQESIVFDERLQAAKILIDECIQGWSKGSNANIKVLILDAFQVDKTGKISTSRVLGLRRHKIEDEKWERAMKAIDDSVQVMGSKPYIRFYERDDETGKYNPINLDVASL